MVGGRGSNSNPALKAPPPLQRMITPVKVQNGEAVTDRELTSHPALLNSSTRTEPPGVKPEPCTSRVAPSGDPK